MLIKEAYKKYKIPPNLQDHMFRVAAIGAYIADHWKNKEEINRGVLIESLLLHDMGNIIKFDLDKFSFIKKEEVPYWKKVQQEFKETYQGDEHKATEMIAKEIGVSPKVQDILTKRSSSSTHDAMMSDDWNKKVYGYVDLRIGPYGVLSINDRFDDVNKRYKGASHHLSDIEYVESRRKLALELEAQIQGRVDCDLQKITDETIAPYLTKVGEVVLKTHENTNPSK